MATLSELAGIIAKAEGMDPAAVSLIARYVREAGFIQKKGRGPSAASMGAADAANLLIAVNASSSARDAPAVVPVYRDLVAAESADKRRTSKIYGTFGEALELVIESAIEGKLPSIFLSEDVPSAVRDAFEKGNASISIHFKRPKPFGFIHISCPISGEVPGFAAQVHASALIAGFPLFFFPKSGRQTRMPRKMNVGDRTDDTEIGNLTIVSVAKLLRSSLRSERKAE